MNENIFEIIETCARTLNLELGSQEIAHYASSHGLMDADLSAIQDLFVYLKDKKIETVVNMLLRTSRLPLKEPKSFENFDFGLIHGKEVEKLQTLPTQEPCVHRAARSRQNSSGDGLRSEMLRTGDEDVFSKSIGAEPETDGCQALRSRGRCSYELAEAILSNYR